jgi:CBS domain-containing protein
MLARDIMSAAPACCLPDTTVREAAQMMEEHDCGCLPVKKNHEERAVIGIVTDRDLVCRALAHNLDSDVASVALVMTTPASTVPASAEVVECARLLGERGIRRLVVLDEGGACCGVISQGDLARHGEVRQTGELVRAVSQPRAAAAAGHGRGGPALVLGSPRPAAPAQGGPGAPAAGRDVDAPAPPLAADVRDPHDDI